jgi:integrase/recombinase XerD
MTIDPSRVRVSGPLAAYAASFGEELLRRGYPPERAARHVGLLAGLSGWLEHHGLTAADLTEERVAEFLSHRRAEGYAEVPTLRWAMTLFGFLPTLGVVPAAVSAPDGPADVLIEEFRRYLVRDRGLAAHTVRGYIAGARSFLSHLEADNGLDLASLTAAKVIDFVLAECQQRQVGSAKVLVTAIRSLLRFMSFKGYTTHPLAGAVPAPSAMGGGYLPRGLDPKAMSALLASCDSSSLVGRRDLAILTVLSRLGLRAGEAAGLQFEDLDWRHGEVLVRGKGARQEHLPLPVDVGEALVAYLRVRPSVEERTVFLRVHAPITAMTVGNVSELVRRACRRAGVEPVGAHRLRHTAATAMLRGGASLAEVGQVLRESRAATTAVYAKVDRVALRTLAQPWPGAVA